MSATVQEQTVELYDADKIGAILKEVGFKGPRRQTTPERERAMGKMVQLITIQVSSQRF